MRIDPIKNYWDKIGSGYALYWKSTAKREINRRELNFINQFLRLTDQRTILDIGIGTGRLIDNYLKIPKVQNIYGIDIAESMVKNCLLKYKQEKRVKNLKVGNIARNKIPFDKKFDFVSIIRVLKYNKNWPEILERVKKSLNKNGVLIFSIPNSHGLRRFTPSEIPMYTASYTEVKRICKKLDLEILQIATFSRIPDIFYDVLNNRLLVKILLLLENLINKLLGNIFLGKIFFVAVKRLDSVSEYR